MQIFTVTDLLDLNARLELKNLVDKEILEALDTRATKYQSFYFQNTKHTNCIPLQKLCKKVEEVANNLLNRPLSISRCWFVICKEDSNFGFHHHASENMSVVYYLENCTNNGTIFELFHTKLQVLSEDNTAIFFNPSIMHSTPEWNGKDRYTIAFDLNFQN